MNYITGTTRGLGKALLDVFSYSIEDEWYGLNRPEFTLDRIDDYVFEDFDYYIINAHYEWSQVDLLYRLFEANRWRRCEIIVIGSVSADGDRKEVNKYAIQKKALDSACTQLQLVDSRCYVTQIKLGRIDTDLVSHIEGQKMDPLEVAEQIQDIVDMNKETHFVKTITIDNKVINNE